MKIRVISLISGMVLFASLAFAQGNCYPAGVVLLDTGRPANGVSVRVCTSGSTGTPCTPAASLFTDPTLGTPLVGSPTVITDAHGNFGFCASAGVNYDLQITGTGITPLTIKNLPLPPTSPIVAAALTSSSANPANVGLVKMATGDCLDWRNNANSGNIQLCKDSSDALDATAFSAIRNSDVKQGATGSFALSDALGVSHFFISSIAPYTNTFINGNGAGKVFLGSAAKVSVDDATGNIFYTRLRPNQGTSISTGNIALSAGWGNTATVGSVAGTDSAFEFKITASGTGQSIAPTITITFADGSWTNPPLCGHMPGISSGQTGTLFGLGIVGSTATTLTLKMDTITPVAGATYGFTVFCFGR